MLIKKRFMPVVLVLALFTVAFTSPQSTTFYIDQSATGSFFRGFQNVADIRMGQEFVPTLRGINRIELFIQDSECGSIPPFHGNSPMQAAVRIHRDTFNGPVIGTSLTTTLAPCFEGVAAFQFSSIVPLIPRNRYVFEPIYIAGRGALVGWLDAVYPNGLHLGDGWVNPLGDVWFQEGVLGSIATTKDQCKNGGWQRLIRADLSTFRNQGDCIQYVNSGK